MKKWIVTGCAGFLGSHVTEQILNQGDQVLGIDNMGWGKEPNLEPLKASDNFTFLKEDIRNRDAILKEFSDFSPENVVHLAALHYIPDAIKNPSEAVSINLHGTQVILEASRIDSVNAVFFASTGDVYEPSEDPHKETSTTKPFNIYGTTKFLGEQLINLEARLAPERKYINGRLFNMIGTRETNPHILPVIFEQLHENPNQLSLGNIFPLRDFVPISQAATAIIQLLQKNTKNLTEVNIATGNACSVENIIHLIADILGRKINVEINQARVRKAERNVLSSDVSKLKEMIGWTPSADLREELTALLKFEGLLS